MHKGYLEFLCAGLLLATIGLGGAGAAEPLPLSYVEQHLRIANRDVVVQVPTGSRLELLTDDLEGPRLLTFAGNGDLFIGSKAGHVYRLPAPYTKPRILLTMRGYPHSVALRQGEILIAQKDGLYRAPYKPGQSRLATERLSLLAALPGGGGHSSRSVAIGPDRRVYLSLGISGNCSNEYLSDEYSFSARRGGILVLQEQGSQVSWEVFASGLRNPVGFAWHPSTGELYASNNGPDHQGFEQPPEYFSHVTQGSFHGMPWFQYDGEQIQPDTCIASPPPRPIGDVPAPVATFPARSAPMGVAFVPAGALHESLENDAVVALRGSWGTQPSGGFIGDPATRRPPKLVTVRFENGEARRVDDLVTGFQLSDGERWARPVGVALGPDGALYFTSDDGVGGLFRLQFESPTATPRSSSPSTD